MPADHSASSAHDTIRVETDTSTGTAYTVIVRRGALRELSTLLQPLPTAHRNAIITDHNVAGLYGESLLQGLAEAGESVRMLTVPAGEESKTRDVWARLTDDLLGAGFGRDSRLIALGGGVIGDLAGFVAATYMRGIAFVNVPTTLLAMIDASVGGKTGVDTRAGKNLVGAFHQPDLVVTDPDVLATLAVDQYRAGLAEALKHGIIADAEYANWILDQADRILRRDAAVVATLIERSVRIKAAAVSKDTREAGIRASLNFGHTIGHALEQASGWTIPHGFGVAMGMLVEARVGERLGVSAAGTAAFIETALERLGLPVDISGTGLDPAAVLAATRTDKKSRSAVVRYVLPAAIGRIARAEDGAWTWPVSDPDVVAAMTGPRGRRSAISQVETDI